MPRRASSTSIAPSPAAEPFAFVTVGTTRFDALASAALADGGVARALGVRRLRCQAGASSLPACVPPPPPGGESRYTHDGVRFEVYRWAPSLADDMAGAAAVVSHAGADIFFESARPTNPLTREVISHNEASVLHRVS